MSDLAPPTTRIPAGAKARRPDPPATRAPRVLAVIPALDEELHVAAVVRGVIRHVDEVLVVDDGSSDRTAEIAGAAGATVLRHPRRRGKTQALRTGFREADRRGFDAVVTLDGDGQHDPDEVPALLRALRETGAAIAAGERTDRDGRMPRSRRAVNGLCSAVASLISGQRLPDCLCGFRAIDVRVLRHVPITLGHFAGEPELLVRAAIRGFRVAHVPIRCVYGSEHSHIRPLVDAVHLLVLTALMVGDRWRASRQRRPPPGPGGV